MVAFTKTVGQAEFSQVPEKRLIAATVRDTVGYISQAFRADLRGNPRRDPDGSLSFLLEHTFKGYTNEDPGVKQKNAIPIIILLKLIDLTQIELATALEDLVCAAFFLAMQPCEYTKTSTTAEKKIKISPHLETSDSAEKLDFTT